jgi:predicted NAD-dependent protein-ADP-ribosyltransferase YbiA (DUF1768 family)
VIAPAPTSHDPIRRWENEYGWLHPDYAMPFMYGGIVFPSLTHAYVGSKTKDHDIRRTIAQTPLERLNNKDVFDMVGTHNGWHAPTMMKDLNEIKFGLSRIGVPGEKATLFKKLAATGHRDLILENIKHDNYWGTCVCDKCKHLQHQNLLGETIKQVRIKIREGMKAWAYPNRVCPCGNTPQDIIVYTTGWIARYEPWCPNCVGRVIEKARKESTDKYLVSWKAIMDDNIIYIQPKKEVKVETKTELLKIEDDDNDPNFDEAYWMSDCGMAPTHISYPPYVKPPEIVREYKTRVIQCVN